jgi:hypothetical protein
MKKVLPQRGAEWVLTYTGRFFYPLDPRPEEICIEDVAHHLSQISRWGGATREFYSDAQRSVLVCRAAPDKLKPAALLHDVPEGLGFNDMQRPLKCSPMMSGYVRAENRCWKVVAKKFGIDPDDICKIGVYDDAVALAEHRDLINDNIAVDWASQAAYLMHIKPYAKKITAWSSKKAERIFLEEFDRLIGRKNS